jgi:hypothetical protein
MTPSAAPTASVLRPLVGAATAAGLVLALAPVQTAAAAAAAARPAVALTGTVERFLVDDFGAAHDDDAALTFVRAAGGAVQVPASSLAEVEDGSTVRVSLAAGAAGSIASLPGAAAEPEAGADVSSAQVVAEPAVGTTDTGTGVATVAAATTSSATTAHKVLVVVAKPAGGSASTVSAAAVRDTINGPVDAYWTKVTGGKVTFTASAYGSTVVTSTTPCSDGGVGGTFAFWDEIKRKTGWTEGPGKHLVVYFAKLAPCGGIAGLGTVGSDAQSGGLLWSNGYNTTGVLGHELGHNLSLGHSNTLDCIADGERVTDARPASCTKRSYADTNDIMGVSWQNQGYLNASHLRFLGTLASTAQLAPTADGRTTLAPLASGAGRRVLALADGGTTYVVEYRQPVGLDSWMAQLPGWGSIGVTVRREFDLDTLPTGSLLNDRESYLLDGRPSSSDDGFGSLKVALPTGTWIPLGTGGAAVRVVSTTSTDAVVEYRTPTPAAQSIPTLTRPTLRLRTGSVSATTGGVLAPTSWTWKVSSGDASAWRTATTATTALASPTAVTFTASQKAYDGTVITAAGTATTLYRPDAAMKGSGGWITMASSTALGGTMRVSRTYGSRIAATVTGRSISVLLRQGPSFGKAAVYVDGVRVATVSMRGTTARTRAAVVKTFAASGTHTVSVRNLGGGPQGRVGVDGLVVVS